VTGVLVKIINSITLLWSSRLGGSWEEVGFGPVRDRDAREKSILSR
jgi:hypothetical protein